jgi:hypothetical protein
MSYRAAKLAVIVLTALIILALIGLAVGMITKLSGRGAPASTTGMAFVLPPGARIVSVQSQPARLILQLHSIAGDEVDVFSTDDGHLVARIRSAP